MRFKQTKPQHLRKKEGHDDCNGSVEAKSAFMDNEDAEWDGYDCVDGDMSPLDCSRGGQSSSDIKVKKAFQQNGHDVVMDLAPMLELYTKDVVKDSKPLLGETPAPAAAENEVIIQGRRPIFSESEESNIAIQLKQWKDQGMKYTRLDVVKMASEYAVQLGKRPQGRPLTVKWFRSFLTRHPECYIRKSRKVKTERPEKQHFNQLDSVLSTYSVKESPHCIFSLMELPLPMLRNGELAIPDSLSPGLLAGLNGSKSQHKVSFEGVVPTSVLFCGSAAGQALPPFLIFPGKTLDKSWMAGVTPGTGGVACSSGRATSEVLISFLREHFLSQAPGRAGDTLVLLLDANVGRCLSQAVLDLGSAFKVVFVTAQSSLNSQLHPMAVGCCNTFQRELCFELEKPLYAAQAPAISSSSICEFLCRLYHRNMSAENLHSTFRKAGIFPFNPSICRKRYGSAVVRPSTKGGQASKHAAAADSGQMKQEGCEKGLGEEDYEAEAFMDDDGDVQ
ncbi:uncharacterized protein LOC101858139 [Aplysia californica]|uniref:Uncharacterized protein LOC101858139 n=1 Tax=Aplysia californica TaxID=6500 RepID=A0ABM0K7R5_APLCA|nr:uncharacterized protein LOC101858139 [Aplysia californica]